MESGYSTLRNLLYVVLVAGLAATGSSFYVAQQLDRNSQELASLRLLLQKQMMGTALAQSEELQKRMDALNQSAAGIDGKMKQAQDQMDAKMKKAQDDFVARMNTELPRMMDYYVKSRAGQLQPMIPQEVKDKLKKSTSQR